MFGNFLDINIYLLYNCIKQVIQKEVIIISYVFDNDKPIYLQLEEIIKKEIFKGELLPSSKIPSVRDFALKYQVNPNTMQKALQGLEEEGFIYTVRTSGKYVTEDREFILKEKRLVAKTLYQDFINNLKSLGYSDTDIKKILKESEI